MMKTSTIIFIFSILTLSSCINIETKVSPLNDTSDEKNLLSIPNSLSSFNIERNLIKTITVPSKSDVFSIDSLLENIRYIKLESNENCIIGKINKIFFDSSYIFIHDHNYDNIFKFDMDGKFCKKIGIQGQGPGEYIEAWDVTINYSKGLLSVLDLAGRKILFYDYSGNLLDKQAMYYYFTQHEYINETNNYIFYTGKSNNNHAPSIYRNELVYADDNHTPSLKGFNFHSDYLGFSYSYNNPLRSFNSNIYYCSYLSMDTIWSIQDSILSANYFIDFEKRGLPKNSMHKNITDEKYRELIHNNDYFSGEYTITEDFLYLQTIVSNKLQHIFYSKNTGQIKSGAGYKNSPLGLFSFPLFSDGNNKFVGIIEPFIAVNYKNPRNTLSQKSNVTWLNNLKETDNPIIIIYSINDF